MYTPRIFVVYCVYQQMHYYLLV